MSFEKPSISILIPNYNKAPFLTQTLNSILNQTFSDWECIIVDDQSTDDSMSILKQFAEKDSRMKLFERPNNLAKGGNVCRNIALNKANGEYVVFFDSDDWFTPDALQERLSLVSKKGFDFVANQGVFWNGQDEKAVLIASSTQRKPLDCFFDFQPLWLSQSLIIRRDFLLQQNIQWDETVPFYQDVLFNIDLLLHTESFCFSEKIDWVWRKSDQQTLGNKAMKVNTYAENKALADNLFALTMRYHKDNGLWFKHYCLQRFYDLMMGNNASSLNKDLLAYPDAIVSKLRLNFLHSTVIKIVARMGIWSYKKNNALGKSIFFRIWKKKWMSKEKLFKKHHFLTESIDISDTDLSKLLKQK
jgi:glycosyltransferase involved in cell wall biosynthesis